jgi:hypothetical protein
MSQIRHLYAGLKGAARPLTVTLGAKSSASNETAKLSIRPNGSNQPDHGGDIDAVALPAITPTTLLATERGVPRSYI